MIYINEDSLEKGRIKFPINIFAILCFFIIFFITKKHNYSNYITLNKNNQRLIDYIDNCKNTAFNLSTTFLTYLNIEYPIISIIIPIFNKEFYIDNLICSLEKQSLKTLEFIFVDDYSTDNSVKKIEKYTKKDKRVKLINNYKNKGVFHTRYLGTVFSKGIYIYFLDPDDFVLDILEESYKMAIEEDLDIVEFLYYKNKNGSFKRVRENFVENYISKNEEVKYYMFFDSPKNKRLSFAHRFLWDKIVKKEVVLKAYLEIGNRYLNKHLITWDDTLLSFFIFRNSKSHKYLNKFGYFWNVGANDSVSSTSNSMKLSKIVNKRFHDIFIYLKIIYEKTEDIEIDRKCILRIWNELYIYFHDKLKYLTDGFELIDNVFKLYTNIKYLSQNERISIIEYYISFLNIRKRIINNNQTLFSY